MNLYVHNIRTHHWLRHPKLSGSRSFHVYLKISKGSESLCKSSPEITDISSMILPGDHSLCCLDCTVKLYGFKPHIFKEDVK